MTEKQLNNLIKYYEKKKTEAEDIDFDDEAAEHYEMIIDELEMNFDDYLEEDVDIDSFKDCLENIIVPKEEKEDKDSLLSLLGL